MKKKLMGMLLAITMVASSSMASSTLAAPAGQQHIATAHIRGVQVEGNLLVWTESAYKEVQEGDVYAYDFKSQRKIIVADGPALQGGSRTNGKVVIWTESTDRFSPSAILGLDIASGRRFTIADKAGFGLFTITGNIP